MEFNQVFYQSHGIELKDFECGFGFRAIWERGNLDVPQDRKAVAGTDSEHWDEFVKLLEGSEENDNEDGGLAKIRGLMAEAIEALVPSEDTSVILIDDGRFLATCNPQGSYGYLYMFVGRRNEGAYQSWMKKAMNPKGKGWKRTVSENELWLHELKRREEA